MSNQYEICDLEPGQSLRFHRVLFLIPPTGLFCREDRCQSFFDRKFVPTMRAPLEECEAAGAVSALGAKAQILDAPALRISAAETKSAINAYAPDLIVISSTFGSLESDLEWIEICRRLIPRAKIGLRGAPCYVVGEKLVTESKADFCLLGDYECAIADLLAQPIDALRGVIIRSEGRVLSSGRAAARDLDLLPLPDRTSLCQELYRARGLNAPQATIRVQRGCPFPCTYCLVHTVSGDRARHRTPASVVAEMQQLLAQGIRHFYLRAETLTLDREWAISLARAIAANCPQARWVSTTRAECVDDELLRELKTGGCYGLSFGLDVGSSVIAKKVRKPLQRQAAIDAMRLCDRHGIVSLAYLMIGFVWDTRDTLNDVRRFVKDVRPDLLTIHYAHPYPGTVYAKDAQNAQLRIASLHAQSEPAGDVGELSSKLLARFGTRVLIRHYARPSVVWSLLRKITPLRLARAGGAPCSATLLEERESQAKRVANC